MPPKPSTKPPAKKYTNKTTGETVEVKARTKKSFSAEKSIPPILPINWADWLGDEHVQDMNEAMEGIYFRILIYLWRFDKIPFNYSKVARLLQLHDQRNARKFLERYGHLFRCAQCGGIPPQAMGDKKSNSDLGVLIPCSCCAYGVSIPCSSDAHSMSDACLCHAPYVLNEKLKNYKNDANSGFSLGTTEQNGTELKYKDNESKPSCAALQRDDNNPTSITAENNTEDSHVETFNIDDDELA